MTHVSRRTFLKLAPCLALAACSQPPSPPFRIATFPWPGYELLFLARSLGYFGDLPIQILEFPSGAECVLAFRHGVVDAATMTLDEVIRVTNSGQEPRIVSLLDCSQGADVILAKPEITNVAQLRNKSVGVESDNLGAYFLARALSENGLSECDLKTVTFRSDRLETEFSAGRLDAVVTYAPYSSRVTLPGARKIFDSTLLPTEIIDVIVVRNDAIPNRERMITGLIDGCLRAASYLETNPRSAVEKMAPRHRVTPEQFQESLSGIRVFGKAENHRLMVASDSPLPATLRRVGDFMAKNALIPSPVNTEQLIASSFMRQLLPVPPQ